MMDNKLFFPCEVEDVSDGYHTFSELYEHRCLLWINVLLSNKEHAFKTWRNDAGEKIEGWFIAGLNTNFGQATYHLPEQHWNLLPYITEFEKNFDYDGHTSTDVLQILEKLAITNRSDTAKLYKHIDVKDESNETN